MDSNPPTAMRGAPLALATLDDAHQESCLFIVERRLPAITDRGLTLLDAALIAATGRIGARGQDVRYLYSLFVPSQDRLISLFRGVTIELVHSANAASLAPYLGIAPAVVLLRTAVPNPE